VRRCSPTRASRADYTAAATLRRPTSAAPCNCRARSNPGRGSRRRTSFARNRVCVVPFCVRSSAGRLTNRRDSAKQFNIATARSDRPTTRRLGQTAQASGMALAPWTNIEPVGIDHTAAQYVAPNGYERTLAAGGRIVRCMPVRNSGRNLCECHKQRNE
jgi:hypothetical protein